MSDPVTATPIIADSMGSFGSSSASLASSFLRAWYTLSFSFAASSSILILATSFTALSLSTLTESMSDPEYDPALAISFFMLASSLLSSVSLSSAAFLCFWCSIASHLAFLSSLRAACGALMALLIS